MSSPAQGETKKKGRGGAITLLITLLVIGLIGALAFIAVDRAILTQSIDRSNLDPRLSQHKIVYECVDDYRTSQLCMIYSDGTGQRQLTPGGQVGVEYYQPKINSSGVVASICHDRQLDQQFYCKLHVDLPHEIQRIEVGEHEPESIFFNDRGDIASLCKHNSGLARNAYDLCWAQAKLEPNIEALNLEGVLDLYGFINGKWMIYLCDLSSGNGNRELTKICAFNLTTEAIRELNVNESGSGGMASGLVINDAGLIVISCLNIESREEEAICIGELDPLILTGQIDTGRDGIYRVTDMNNSGEAVIECQMLDDPVENGICLFDAQTRAFRWLTEAHNPDYVNPVINDAGMIAFSCDSSLCVIHSDGSGYRVLTSHDEDHHALNPSIQ